MATIRGIIYSLYTKEPLGGVSVYLATEAITTKHIGTVTDAEGNYVLQGVPKGTFALQIQYDPEGSVYSFGAPERRSITVEQDDETQVIDLYADNRGAIHGTVKDASSGAPIQGASVKIMEETHGQIGSPTNERGEYSLSFLTPGTYTIRLTAAGYEPEAFTAHAKPIFSSNDITQMNIFLRPIPSERLPDYGMIKGNVVNQYGRVVFGARLDLAGHGGFHKIASVVKDWCDEYEGNFTIQEIPPGTYELTVSRSGYETITKKVSVSKGHVTWVNDLILKLTAPVLPLDLEYIHIEPESPRLGDSIKISIKPVSPEILGVSARMWGPRGWNIGFGLDNLEPDGGKSRTFKNWQIPGMFVIDSVNITDKHGRTFTVTTNATFEVFSSSIKPLSPSSDIFNRPR